VLDWCFAVRHSEQRIVTVDGVEYMAQAWETVDPWITKIDAYDRDTDGVSWGTPVRLREYDGAALHERSRDEKKRRRSLAALAVRIIDASFPEHNSRRETPLDGRSLAGYAVVAQPPFVVRKVFQRFGIPIYADSTARQIGETLLRFIGTKRRPSPDFARLLARALIAGDDEAQLRWGQWVLAPDEMVAAEERRLLAKTAKGHTAIARTTGEGEAK
jgi:hypothetical protein